MIEVDEGFTRAANILFLYRIIKTSQKENVNIR